LCRKAAGPAARPNTRYHQQHRNQREVNDHEAVGEGYFAGRGVRAGVRSRAAGGRLWQPQIAAAQAKQPAVGEVVRARSFEAVDEAGKTRANLSLLGGTPVLSFYDAAGKQRATVGMNLDGTPSLGFRDARGNARGVLGINAEGATGVLLSDAAGKVRARLVAGPEGEATLALSDAYRVRLGLMVLSDGSAVLNFVDAAGKARAMLHGVPDGRSGLTLFDAAGEVIWKAP